MTPAAPAATRRSAAGRQRTLFETSPARRAGHERSPAATPGGGGLTLERRLDRVWEGLAAAGAAACPICDGELQREPAGGRGACARCGTTLS